MGNDLLYFYNSITRKREAFTPISNDNVTIYVCGPTVYDVPHIGNLRSVVVYDLLYRVLKTKYHNVTYVRNITDVDDKIIARALQTGQSPDYIAKYYSEIFHSNALELGCLDPTFEPKATDHIDDMIAMISCLLENGHAYVVGSNVYFDVSSYPEYAKLSGRDLSELLSGSRIEVEQDKHDVNDFVLWKSTEDESFNSPWGRGRPGWHIECSAMSNKYLGHDFDIHGGGVDLKFPHHENEIAQSCCASKGSHYAKYWIHNGFLTVNGEKMSKSLGNVLYLAKLLEGGLDASLVRYILLSSHYRKPLDWTRALVSSCKSSLQALKRCLKFYEPINTDESTAMYKEFLGVLYNDLNTALSFAFLHKLIAGINYATNSKNNLNIAIAVFKSLSLLGINCEMEKLDNEQLKHIEMLISKRKLAKEAKDFVLADSYRKELNAMNIEVYDQVDGSTKWEITK